MLSVFRFRQIGKTNFKFIALILSRKPGKTNALPVNKEYANDSWTVICYICIQETFTYYGLNI